VTVINPPTLDSLGLLDNAAHTLIYAASQGQSGTTTFTLRAAYPGREFPSAIGSLTGKALTGRTVRRQANVLASLTRPQRRFIVILRPPSECRGALPLRARALER
jgi:hypothetical protein